MIQFCACTLIFTMITLFVLCVRVDRRNEKLEQKEFEFYVAWGCRMAELYANGKTDVLRRDELKDLSMGTPPKTETDWAHFRKFGTFSS